MASISCVLGSTKGQASIKLSSTKGQASIKVMSTEGQVVSWRPRCSSTVLGKVLNRSVRNGFNFRFFLSKKIDILRFDAVRVCPHFFLLRHRIMAQKTLSNFPPKSQFSPLLPYDWYEWCNHRTVCIQKRIR